MATFDGSERRSRRAILASAAGGAAAISAGMLANAAPALANGEPMVVGGRHTGASSPTYLRNERNDRMVLVAESSVSGGIGVGGAAREGVGVIGWSGTGDGVRGESIDGFAVSGYADDGFAVAAGTSSGAAVWATADDGVGVLALARTLALGAISDGGYVLATGGGRVRLNDISGVATIAAGKRAVVIHPLLPVTKDAFVLLSPRADLGDRGLWYTTDPRAGSVTIHVSRPVQARAAIAWLLLEHGGSGGSASLGGPDLERASTLLRRGRAQRARLSRRRAPIGDR